MQISKVESYFGFAVKSNSVCFGTDNILKSNGQYLILLCDAISENAKKKIYKFSREKNIKIITLTKEEMFIVTKRENCLAAGITNQSLSGAIEKVLSNNIGGNNA